MNRKQNCDGKTERNKVIDIWRTLAIFLVLVNHFWGLISNVEVSSNRVIYFFEKFGGELGVTIFFALSGYGIFCSLDRDFTQGKYNYWNYLKKRINRMVPQYWASLIIIILLGDGAYYLSTTGITSVLLHIVLLHNLFPSASGSINGVLWTLGAIFHFYFIAPVIYRLLIKFKGFVAVVAAAISIGTKAVIYHYMLPALHIETYTFWAGRQLLLPVLDSFVYGMLLAYFWVYYAKHIEKTRIFAIIGGLITVLSGFLIYLWADFGTKNGIHTDNISGYVFHSVLAILCIILIMGMSIIQKAGYTYGDPVSKFLVWISKYEYGIYIWHYVLVSNIVAKSSWMIFLINNNLKILAWILAYAVVIAFSVVMTKAFDQIKIFECKIPE